MSELRIFEGADLRMHLFAGGLLHRQVLKITVTTELTLQFIYLVLQARGCYSERHILKHILKSV